MTHSILDIQVSCFAHCKATTPVDVSLLTWLTTDKYKSKVEQIRNLQDVDLQKTIKTSLPAITPSGRFSRRDTEHLIEHTGFLAFDIDFKDNRHISNFDRLRDEIKNITSVAYCGLSVRGHGFWGLVPVPASTPEVHRQRFDTLIRDFREFGIILDPSGSDVCRLRIASYDADAYFNPQAKVYTKIYKPAPPKNLPRPKATDSRGRVEALVSQIKAYRIDITQSYDDEWLPIAAGLANEFGEWGRGYFHAISQFHPNYDPRETDDQYDAVLRKRYNQISLGSLFHIAKQYGIVLKPDPVTVPPSRVNERINPTGESTPVNSPTALSTPVNSAITPDPWNVAELEKFFSAKDLPADPIRLNDWTTITDVRLFTETHLAIAKAHNGNARYEPYMERLNDLKIILS